MMPVVEVVKVVERRSEWFEVRQERWSAADGAVNRLTALAKERAAAVRECGEELGG